MILTHLGFGVKKIAEGKIKEEEVEWFITADKFNSFKEAIETFSETFWKGNEEECAEILKRVFGRVIQPRVILNDNYRPYVGELCYENLKAFEAKEDNIAYGYNVCRELRNRGYFN